MKTLTRLNIPTKTVVLAAVALVLALLYTVQIVVSPNRNTIDLPTVGAEITLIEIGENGESLTLERSDDGWVVGEERYPGDAGIVDALVEAALAIDSVDVISERGGDERFGFGEDTVRTLVLHTAEEPVLAFTFGAAAAAGDAVYGRVQDESAVVLLPGSLQNSLRLDPGYYRDKVIARLTTDAIDEVLLEADGFPEVSMRRIAVEATEDEADLTETELLEREWEARIGGVIVDAPAAIDDDSAEDGGVTEDEEGDTIPGYLRQNFFQELAALRVDRFPVEDLVGEPFARLTISLIDGGSEEITIYPPDENFAYPITATTNPYSAVIPEFRVRRLLLGRSEIIERLREE